MEKNSKNYIPQGGNIQSCYDCGRQARGHSMGICGNGGCQNPICLKCRGLRSFQYKCKSCKHGEEYVRGGNQEMPAQTVSAQSKIVRALFRTASEAQELFLSGNDAEASKIADELFLEIMQKN